MTRRCVKCKKFIKKNPSMLFESFCDKCLRKTIDKMTKKMARKIELDIWYGRL